MENIIRPGKQLAKTSSRLALALTAGLLFVFTGSAPGLAQSSANVTSVPNNSMERISAHGTCRLVGNRGGATLAVPHDALNEWAAGSNAFLAATPDAVNVTLCPDAPISIDMIGACYISPADGHTRCAGAYADEGFRGDGNTGGTTLGSTRYTDTFRRVTTTTSGDFIDVRVVGGTACGLSDSGIWCWGVHFGNTPSNILPGDYVDLSVYRARQYSSAYIDGGYPCGVTADNVVNCRLRSGGIEQVTGDSKHFWMFPGAIGGISSIDATMPQCRVRTNGDLQCRGDWRGEPNGNDRGLNYWGNIGNLGTNWRTINTGGRHIERVFDLGPTDNSPYFTFCAMADTSELICFGPWDATNYSGGYPTQNNDRLTTPSWRVTASAGVLGMEPVSGNGTCFYLSSDPSSRRCVRHGNRTTTPSLVTPSGPLSNAGTRMFAEYTLPNGGGLGFVTAEERDANYYVDTQGRFFIRGCLVNMQGGHVCSGGSGYSEIPRAN